MSIDRSWWGLSRRIIIGLDPSLRSTGINFTRLTEKESMSYNLSNKNWIFLHFQMKFALTRRSFIFESVSGTWCGSLVNTGLQTGYYVWGGSLVYSLFFITRGDSIPSKGRQSPIRPFGYEPKSRIKFHL